MQHQLVASLWLKPAVEHLSTLTLSSSGFDIPYAYEVDFLNASHSESVATLARLLQDQPGAHVLSTPKMTHP